MQHSEIFAQLNKIEYKLIEHDEKIETIFKTLESTNNIPRQGIFFEGQIFDAYKFVSDLIRKAKK